MVFSKEFGVLTPKHNFERKNLNITAKPNDLAGQIYTIADN